MQWAWATSLDQLWRSPSFPMWATLAAAGFFALVVLIVLLRADKTMANGALSVIALLAIGIASTTTVRGFGNSPRTVDASMDTRTFAQPAPPVAALSCLDGLAGDSVEAACEKAVFGAADTAAAAVSYAAAQVSRVIVAAGARSLAPEQQVLKRAVERDRYGLVAQVIGVRDRCIVTDCPLFRVLSDAEKIKANMNDRLYDTLVARYSSSWTAAAAATAAAPPAPAASLLPGLPSGRPTTVDFANSAAIPPVNIMTPEPPPAAQAAAPKQQPAPAPTAAASKSSNAQAQAKRQPAATQANSAPSTPPAASIGRPRVVAPVPFVPSQVGDDN